MAKRDETQTKYLNSLTVQTEGSNSLDTYIIQDADAQSRLTALESQTQSGGSAFVVEAKMIIDTNQLFEVLEQKDDIGTITITTNCTIQDLVNNRYSMTLVGHVYDVNDPDTDLNNDINFRDFVVYDYDENTNNGRIGATSIIHNLNIIITELSKSDDKIWGYVSVAPISGWPNIYNEISFYNSLNGSTAVPVGINDDNDYLTIDLYGLYKTYTPISINSNKSVTINFAIMDVGLQTLQLHATVASAEKYILWVNETSTNQTITIDKVVLGVNSETNPEGTVVNKIIGPKRFTVKANSAIEMSILSRIYNNNEQIIIITIGDDLSIN